MLLIASLLLFSGTAHSEDGSYGLLWLDLQPADANVVLDGRFLDAKVWLISVPPGSHALSVGKPGYKSYSSQFDIEASQSLHIDVHLDPEDSLSGDKPVF